MRVLIPVSERATVHEHFEIRDGEVGSEYLTYELNEWDEYALEAAVQIQQARDGVELVAVTIGPERCEETIRKALAKGADRAIRIWDEPLADRDVLDPGTKAQLLAAVAEREDPALVLTGVQSGDHAWSATGVALAAECGYQWAAVVNQLELDADVENARVHRELEGGVDELMTVELPAVLTIQTGINHPRYASLRRIQQAHAKELERNTLDDLEVTLETDHLRRRHLTEPQRGGPTEYVEGDPDEQARQLVGLLEDQEVIET